MLLLVGSYARIGWFFFGQKRLRKLGFIYPRMLFLMDLVNNLIVLFLLIFKVLFMQLLVGSPFSVCCFLVHGQKLQIEFFVS